MLNYRNSRKRLKKDKSCKDVDDFKLNSLGEEIH